MYVDVVKNRSSPPAVLLRESTRVGEKVFKRTIANVSHWPAYKIENVRRALNAGPKDLLGGGTVRITRSLPHGAVHAVLGTLRKLGLERVISAMPCRERDLVVGMIVARVLFPTSKLDTICRWRNCTLAEELQVADADSGELYGALDWLLERQGAIEKKLAKKHLGEGAAVLYDLSSSYYHGKHCPLAKFGHNRDGKNGLPIIVYGVLANRDGCPVAVDVYAGNTADPKTVPDQVTKLRAQFGLQRVVLTADRGCITTTNVKTLREFPEIGWIGALRSNGIRKLMAEQIIETSLFDQTNLAEITSPDHPGERLVACMNPLLLARRREKRESLLKSTEKKLTELHEQMQRATEKGKPLKAGKIGEKVGRVVNGYKVAKHFITEFKDGSFTFARNGESIAAEQALDGIYVIRTSEKADEWPTADVVRGYKQLSHVERAFRCIKGVDLKVRPIWLRKEEHVKAHVLLCVLAYYVEWHMQNALKELLFADEELAGQRATRDPVMPPPQSESVKAKKQTQKTPDGLDVQSFGSLLQNLATLTRNVCAVQIDGDDRAADPTYTVLADATPLQKRALELLNLYPVK